MKINLGQVFVSRSSFDTVNEIMYKGKMKNFSQVVEDIINSYISMSGQHAKLIEKIQQQNKKIFDLERTITDYRIQIVGDSPLAPPVTPLQPQGV